MIDAVIFDCFGVLYADSEHYFLEQNVADYERLRPELLQIFRAGDYGMLTQAEICQAVAEITGLDEQFIANNIQGLHRRNDELLAYAQALRPKYKLGMLSNVGVSGMDQFFSKPERQQLFDAVVLSGEEHMTKPSPQIFELTAERLGVRPDECVMIDDILENCHGADAAGMRWIHHQTNRRTITDLDKMLEENYA